jgi:hypothetical protein
MQRRHQPRNRHSTNYQPILSIGPIALATPTIRLQKKNGSRPVANDRIADGLVLDCCVRLCELLVVCRILVPLVSIHQPVPSTTTEQRRQSIVHHVGAE